MPSSRVLWAGEQRETRLSSNTEGAKPERGIPAPQLRAASSFVWVFAHDNIVQQRKAIRLALRAF